MKARTRFCSTGMSVFLLLVFFIFLQPLKIRYRKAIGLLPDRIVIFGDESSAIPPPAEFVHRRSEDQPAVPTTWASNFCKSLHASCDSFAPNKPTEGFVGSVIDNIVFNTSSPDLRDQVDRWIEFETKARRGGSEPERSSLFALFFGTNDVWEFSYLSRGDAVSAVEASLDSMFEQIGRVARHWADPLQVLVPTAIDVTMLPAWAKYRVKNDTSGEQLRNAVFLSRKWNEDLAKRAERWKGGSVMLWDADQWFMDTLRSGKDGGWQDVRDSCLKDHDKACEHPEKYLMWDDLHLGARAHKIMAKAVMSYLL